jgi:hypothetical protein
MLFRPPRADLGASAYIVWKRSFDEKRTLGVQKREG